MIRPLSLLLVLALGCGQSARDVRCPLGLEHRPVQSPRVRLVCNEWGRGCECHYMSWEGDLLAIGPVEPKP